MEAERVALIEHNWYQKRSLWSVAISEFIGTLLLLYIITLALAVGTDVTCPLAIGGGLLGLCNIFGDISGAHFNPCITLAVFLTERRFPAFRAVVYAGAQLLGGIVGCSAAAVTCEVLKDPYSVSAHKPHTLLQISFAEIIFTAILTTTALRNGFLVVQPSTFTPLWIAGCVIAASYAGGPISGACLNPAVALPFAIKRGAWLDLTVYTIAPLGGGVLSALFVMFVDPAIWARRVGLSASAVNIRIPSAAAAGAEYSPAAGSIPDLEYLAGRSTLVTSSSAAPMNHYGVRVRPPSVVSR